MTSALLLWIFLYPYPWIAGPWPFLASLLVMFNFNIKFFASCKLVPLLFSSVSVVISTFSFFMLSGRF